VLCADASGVVARSPAKAKSSRIPVVVDFVIFASISPVKSDGI
jgi:hypothetical protein